MIDGASGSAGRGVGNGVTNGSAMAEGGEAASLEVGSLDGGIAGKATRAISAGRERSASRSRPGPRRSADESAIPAAPSPTRMRLVEMNIDLTRSASFWLTAPGSDSAIDSLTTTAGLCGSFAAWAARRAATMKFDRKGGRPVRSDAVGPNVGRAVLRWAAPRLPRPRGGPEPGSIGASGGRFISAAAGVRLRAGNAAAAVACSACGDADSGVHPCSGDGLDSVTARAASIWLAAALVSGAMSFTSSGGLVAAPPLPPELLFST